MTNFKIEIVSDTVCPWCYVGHKQLQRAIASYRTTHPTRSSDTFSITWKPFYLNPDAPSPSIEKTPYFKQKFGEERTAMIFQRLSAVGDSVGIKFRFGGKTGNTRDSHRLIQLGKTKGEDVQTRVVEELFRKYFEEESDITQKDVLLDAVGKAGLDQDEAKVWLDNGKGGKEVHAEVKEANEKGISGVPFFTVQGRFDVEGAQDWKVFANIFEKVLKGEEGANGSNVGAKC